MVLLALDGLLLGIEFVFNVVAEVVDPLLGEHDDASIFSAKSSTRQLG